MEYATITFIFCTICHCSLDLKVEIFGERTASGFTWGPVPGTKSLQVLVSDQLSSPAPHLVKFMAFKGLNSGVQSFTLWYIFAVKTFCLYNYFPFSPRWVYMDWFSDWNSVGLEFHKKKLIGAFTIFTKDESTGKILWQIVIVAQKWLSWSDI